MPGAYIDMAFLPTVSDRAVFKEAGAPLILGTQSHRPLSDFTMVFVSISCVPELVNLPFLLGESAIPLWAGARAEGIPPIILGGSSVSAAHGLVREDGDCMADALFFGEGEGAAGTIAAMWAAAPASRRRRALLASIADAVPGLWPAGDPSRRVQRAIAPEGAAGVDSTSQPILPGEEAGTAQLQITRGCPCLCSFCFEGFDRKPFRQITHEELSRAALALKESSGAETLEISSFNFNTHERIVSILRETNGLFARVNAMSQRADILASTPELLEVEAAGGKRSFTIGVEGVSESLRKFLHKSLEEAELRAVVERLHALRVREIKLFYILTGREEEPDFKELSAFVHWMTDLRKMDGGPRMILSFGLLVRMPFTPLRHDGLLLDPALWRRLSSRARAACGPFEFRLAAGIGEYLLIQALAGGDRWTVELVEELASRGVVYDGGFSPGAEEILHSWIERHGGVHGGLSAEKPEGHPFPLPFLENPEERAFLHAQYVKAVKRIDDGYCRRGLPEGCGPVGDRRQCSHCTLGTHPGSPAAPLPQAAAVWRREDPAAGLADTVLKKARLSPVLYGVEIPEEWAAPDGTWLAAVLLRHLCRLGVRENVLRAREVLITPWLGPAFRGAWSGRGIVSVTAWDAAAVTAALQDGQASAAGPRFFALERPEASFSSIRFSVELPRRLFPNAEAAVSTALTAMHASFTAHKDGEWYRMVVSPRALGRKILLDGRYRRGAEGLLLEMEAGPKMSASTLFQGLSTGGSGIILKVAGFTA